MFIFTLNSTIIFIHHTADKIYVAKFKCYHQHGKIITNINIQQAMPQNPRNWSIRNWCIIIIIIMHWLQLIAIRYDVANNIECKRVISHTS